MKIQLFKELKKEEGLCDFCGQEKNCVIGNPIKYLGKEFIDTKLKKVIDDWEYSLFSNKKIIKGGYDYEFFDTYETKEKETRRVHICFDCSKQITDNFNS